MRVMKRHIPLKIFLAVLGVLLLAVLFFVGRAMIHKSEPESYGSYIWAEKKESFSLDLFRAQDLRIGQNEENLRVMQIADPQLKFGFMTHDTKTIDLISRAIDKEKPHICVVTGDLTMSLFTYDAYKYFANFMEEKKQYWTLTFGNHDLEFDCSAYTIANLLKDYEYCLFDLGPSDVKGKSNFLINVYRGEDTVPAYSLIMLDSGMYPEGGGGLLWIYDSFDQTQLDFYRWTVEGLKKENGGVVIKSSLFFHIPIQEYAMMYYAKYGSDTLNTEQLLPVREVEGTVCEDEKDPLECVDEGYTVGIYYQGENTGLYALAAELGSTTAMFAGHDHANTLRGYYGDIYLAYGICTGYHTYPLFEKSNFLTDLLGLSSDIYFNQELWKDEDGKPYEKGVAVIDICIDKESGSYGNLIVEFKCESDLK